MSTPIEWMAPFRLQLHMCPRRTDQSCTTLIGTDLEDHHTGGHCAYERDHYENAGEKTKRDEEVDRSHDSTPHAARAQFLAKNA